MIINAAPTPPTVARRQSIERLLALDVLRGFAVLGVLIVDIPGFASPAGLPGYAPPPAIAWHDSMLEGLVSFLAVGKFYTIFSFLFGLGFSLQLTRAEAAGIDVRTFYPRRLLVLLGFGIVHAVFLWTADILRLYSVLGFALLAFRKRTDRYLLISATLCLVLRFAVAVVGQVSSATSSAGIPGVDVVGMARAAYHGSSYLDVLYFQALCAPASFVMNLVIRGPNVMALFLLGLLIGRSGRLARLTRDRAMLRRSFTISLLVGFAGCILVWLTRNPWLAGLGATVGTPGLAASYMSGLTWFGLNPRGGAVLAPLISVGRMALSNYLLQSVICSLLFGGFGFGLYEKVNQAGLMGIAVLIYLAQAQLSVWWLQRFEFGPAEWLWRWLTYGRGGAGPSVSPEA